eukprot:TRINITY_DN10125_c0_g1_i1.p1 TRINITY_DN10125_c0_g1~~TRINITY_DN10125_c0_g1_i1.p1  ORF type:complete len:146 (+),score=14.10 TRINITY_DN10125_c0_g1_i1:34-438(+)
MAKAFAEMTQSITKDDSWTWKQVSPAVRSGCLVRDTSCFVISKPVIHPQNPSDLDTMEEDHGSFRGPLNAFHTYSYSIAHNPGYQLPVMYFTASHSDGSLLHEEEIWKDFAAQPSNMENIISQCVHVGKNTRFT